MRGPQRIALSVGTFIILLLRVADAPDPLHPSPAWLLLAPTGSVAAALGVYAILRAAARAGDEVRFLLLFSVLALVSLLLLAGATPDESGGCFNCLWSHQHAGVAHRLSTGLWIVRWNPQWALAPLCALGLAAGLAAWRAGLDPGMD